MELRSGERYIKVNTLIALTGFLSEHLDLVTPVDNLYVIAEVIGN